MIDKYDLYINIAFTLLIGLIVLNIIIILIDLIGLKRKINKEKSLFNEIRFYKSGFMFSDKKDKNKHE